MNSVDFWDANANALIATALMLIAFFLFWGVVYRRPQVEK